MILKNKKKFSKQDKELLWERYREDPRDLANYNLLLEAYLPLVEVIASKSKAVLPAHLEIEDLVNDAFFGLVDAVEKFDESLGYKFETYASTRIRGHITDCLRDYDWVSRYSRLKFKQVASAELSLQESLQREPTMAEIAELLDWSVEDTHKAKNAYMNSFSVNIDEYITDATHESFSLQEVLVDSSEDDLSVRLELAEIHSSVQEALFKLDEHESIVIYLCFFEQMNFAKVAELLELDSARVGKIYDRAILKIKEYIEFT